MRRRSLLAAAGAGTGLLAGCQWLADSDPPTETDSPTGGDGTPPDDGTSPDGDGDGPTDLSENPANPLNGIGGYRVASAYTSGGTGTPDDPWRLPSAVVSDAGLVVFDAGSFVTDGLHTGRDIDYERWSVWLRGAGVRTTRVQKLPKDGHLLEFDGKKPGNFGGASGMALHGHYPNTDRRSTGDLIHSSGRVIDLIFRDLIVRYGWGDGIHIEESSSGTRIHNCWIENSQGWAVYMAYGTRAKLSNLHIITCFDGAIFMGNDNAQIANVSLYNVLPGMVMDCEDTEVSTVKITGADFTGPAITETNTARSNLYSNIVVEDATVGVVLRGDNSHLTNSTIRETGNEAVRLLGDQSTATGVTVNDFGRNGSPAVELAGDACQLSALSVGPQSGGYGSRTLARVTGDRAVLANVTTPPGLRVEVDGATEAILTGITGPRADDIADGGTRTLVNGVGTNAGDPRRTGEWQGHADYAAAMGATVWDTTTSPWTAYRADGDGNWLRE